MCVIEERVIPDTKAVVRLVSFINIAISTTKVRVVAAYITITSVKPILNKNF